jgi:dimethylhistidine N-methyltransferase
VRPHGAAALAVRTAPIAEDVLRAEVIAGLEDEPKRLHPKYFYDAVGSALFERICEQPEYYLTRTERSILETHLPDFARDFGTHARVIEPGSGASVKTRILLDALPDPAAYIPVDISPTHLLAAAEELADRYPTLEVLPVCADFTERFELPRGTRPFARTLVFFPGSTIGNLDPAQAASMLTTMRRMARADGVLLVGADLRKNPLVLESAYNDAAGVTAAFNRNILAHLNERFGADFEPEAFEHVAFWNARAGRIEMHLVSGREQVARIGHTRIAFARDESIWTESCYKYDNAQFAALARRAGLEVRDVWMDKKGLFSVQVLTVGAG